MTCNCQSFRKFSKMTMPPLIILDKQIHGIPKFNWPAQSPNLSTIKMSVAVSTLNCPGRLITLKTVMT